MYKKASNTAARTGIAFYTSVASLGSESFLPENLSCLSQHTGNTLVSTVLQGRGKGGAPRIQLLP